MVDKALLNDGSLLYGLGQLLSQIALNGSAIDHLSWRLWKLMKIIEDSELPWRKKSNFVLLLNKLKNYIWWLHRERLCIEYIINYESASYCRQQHPYSWKR